MSAQCAESLPVMPIRLIWRSDAHLADKPPRSRIDDWASAILDKLTQVGEIAREMEADAVIDGGDLFHVKSPSRNSHDLVRRVAEVHANYPCPVYLTPGNHDLKYGSLEYLAETPLGVLYESGVVRRLYDEHEADFVYISPKSTGGMHNTPKVRVVGIPYHGPDYEFNRFTTITKGDEDWLIVVAHCLANPDGGTLFDKEDIISYSQLANLDPDIWCFSHWHKYQGIQEIAKDKWAVNLGSLSRGSLSEDDLNRTPCCAVVTFGDDGVDFEVHPLTVRPADRVFDVEGANRSRQRTMSMEAFAISLRETLISQSGKSLLDAARQADAPSEVRERAIAYLEKAGAK